MKNFIFGAVAIVLLCAAGALAQTTSSTPAPSASPSATANIREQIKNTRQEANQEIKDTRQTALAQIKTLTASTTAQIEQKRQELKVQIQQNLFNMRQSIVTKREEMKTKVEAQRQFLKDSLKKIKNEAKQNRVLKISDSLQSLNNVMADHFLAVLARLDTILNNIISRTDKAQSEGLDVAVVRTAISDAQKAISASRDKVKAQAIKTYPITIASTTASSTEKNLKLDVGKIRQALHDDLVAVRATVVVARDAVHKAATTLAQIKGIDDVDSDASPSPSVSANPNVSPSATASPSSSASSSPSATASPSPSNSE